MSEEKKAFGLCMLAFLLGSLIVMSMGCAAGAGVRVWSVVERGVWCVVCFVAVNTTVASANTSARHQPPPPVPP